MTLSEFIDMGGYGAYVWSSYAICCIVLIMNVIQPVLRERKTNRELQKRLQSRDSNKRDNQQ